jgi:acyl carrier protein
MSSPPSEDRAAMTREEICAKVIAVLGNIAPELDAATLAPKAELRDQLDLDSMDFLNFALGLHTAFGIDIPEADTGSSPRSTAASPTSRRGSQVDFGQPATRRRVQNRIVRGERS